MKKLLALLLLASATMQVYAQFCCHKPNTRLFYTVWNKEQQSTTTDTLIIADAYTINDTLVVIQRNLSQGEFSSITFRCTNDGSTYLTLIDSDKFSEIIKKQLASTLPEDSLTSDKEEKLRKKQQISGSAVVPLHPKAIPGNEIASSMFQYKLGPIRMKVSVEKCTNEGYETITTQAGTFECLKISYQLKYKMMFMSESSYFTDWYAENIGLVKGIETDKKGRVVATRELIGIENPD